MLFPFVKMLVNQHELGKYENIDKLLLEVEELLNTKEENKVVKLFKE